MDTSGEDAGAPELAGDLGGGLEREGGPEAAAPPSEDEGCGEGEAAGEGDEEACSVARTLP